MITIQPSKTADTRTCDFSKVTKETLMTSSWQHIGDVQAALRWLGKLLHEAGQRHDSDKLSDLDSFHADFLTGFKEHSWWDRHRKITRHHLGGVRDEGQNDGVPADVNLIDVMEFIADCVMAGMARSGSVYPLQLPPDVLERAFQNTVEMLKAQVVVKQA